VLTDPRAIRVLAHEARLAILDELVLADQALTASELAARIGSTPSALSYHLRLLERYGLVARANPREDGRERPWVRTADGIKVDTQGAIPGEAAQQLVLRRFAENLHQRWTAWSEAAPTAPEEWRDAGLLNRTRLWVTAEELATLTEALESALDVYRGRRDSAARPTGSRPVDILLSMVPRLGR
jgi:DNA-binding transcriptional ArsR family regulator